MPPKGTKRKPPLGINKLASKEKTVSRELFHNLGDSIFSSDSDSNSPVFERSRSVGDLTAVNNTNKPNMPLNSSIVITHSQSATNLSPPSNSKSTEIEKSILALSSSLRILTQNVTTITTSMATKTELSALKKKVDAAETTCLGSLSDLSTEFKKHDQILISNAEARDDLASSISANTQAISSLGEQQTNLSNRIDGLARTRNRSATDFRSEIDQLKTNIAKQSAEITLLRNEQSLHAKSINSINLLQVGATDPDPDPVPAPVTAGNVYNNQIPEPQPATNGEPLSPLNIIVEGLVEDTDENLASKVTALCNSIGANVSIDDIVHTARIQRRHPIVGRPNPARITFRSLTVKDRVMHKKLNLRGHPTLNAIWINHDEPAQVRRAKGRARHIATFARKKGSVAQVNTNGIVLDSVYYSFDNLSAIPSIYIPPSSLTLPEPQRPPLGGANSNQSVPNCPPAAADVRHNNVNNIQTPLTAPQPRLVRCPTPQQIGPTEEAPGQSTRLNLPTPTWPNRPELTNAREVRRPPPPPTSIGSFPSIESQSLRHQHTQKNRPIEKMRETKMGLVYSGLTARFSHLYKVEILIDGLPYNSVEQKLQFEKATLAKLPKVATTIMNTHNTHEIKNIGDKIPLSPEWIIARRPCAANANQAKFSQHRFLMDALISTAGKRLIEGTTSAFWGGGARYESNGMTWETRMGRITKG